jgi:bacteriocin biosynthesis cyclodehydratase domain-containing protein
MVEEQYFVSPGLQVVKIDDTRLSLNLYGRRFTLKDETGLIEAIFVSAILHGVNRVQLLEEHPHGWPAEVIDTVLKSLCSSNFLQPSNKRTLSLATLDFLSHSSSLVDKVVSGFSEAVPVHGWCIRIAGQGELADALGEVLAKQGIRWTSHQPEDSFAGAAAGKTLLVACADNSDHSFFRRINSSAISAGIASLFVSLDAHVAKCGPMVMPRANACYECYFHRVSSTRAHVEEFDAASRAENIICHPTPNFLALHWAVSAALSKILAVTSGLDMDLHLAPIQEINVFNGDISSSRLLKIPRCPVCGTANGTRPFSAVINTKLALKAG